MITRSSLAYMCSGRLAALATLTRLAGGSSAILVIYCAIVGIRSVEDSRQRVRMRIEFDKH